MRSYRRSKKSKSILATRTFCLDCPRRRRCACSGVRQFEVQLRGTADALQLTVRDKGLGFDPDDAIDGRGLGLTSMKERLKLVGGELLIKSGSSRGTTIVARVPLPPTIV